MTKQATINCGAVNWSLPNAEIARRFGCRPSTVHYARKQHDPDNRTRREACARGEAIIGPRWDRKATLLAIQSFSDETIAALFWHGEKLEYQGKGEA